MRSIFDLDKKWTLFLDRDGVINTRLPGAYVKDIVDFEFQSGVKEAIASFSLLFDRIIVVTNQQGIGKGLMSEQDLQLVHQYMKTEIQNAGGRVDAIYHCPALAKENSPLRKPQAGMAFKAFQDFPEIDPQKAIMVGDSLSDMKFALNAQLIPIFLKTDPEYPEEACTISELQFANLHDFALYLQEITQ